MTDSVWNISNTARSLIQWLLILRPDTLTSSIEAWLYPTLWGLSVGLLIVRLDREALLRGLNWGTLFKIIQIKVSEKQLTVCQHIQYSWEGLTKMSSKRKDSHPTKSATTQVIYVNILQKRSFFIEVMSTNSLQYILKSAPFVCLLF